MPQAELFHSAFFWLAVAAFSLMLLQRALVQPWLIRTGRFTWTGPWYTLWQLLTLVLAATAVVNLLAWLAQVLAWAITCEEQLYRPPYLIR